MKTYKILNDTVTITEEDVTDIMSSAFYGGIDYWCKQVRPVEEDYLSEIVEEHIGLGGSYKLLTVDKEVYELNLEKLLNGIELLYNEGYDYYNVIEDGVIDCCQVDAVVADNIVQLSIFGDIIYG